MHGTRSRRAILSALLLGAGAGAHAQDTWTATSTTGAPAAREGHTAVWTGTQMIVFGGYSGPTTTHNTGGRYDPSGNSWTATTTTGATGRAFHSAVWTGTRMIVWGGHVNTLAVTNTGGSYDPTTNAWTATSTTGAPSARYQHTAVWTGTKMIVWGGYDGGFLNSGAAYDPATDTWTPLSTAGAPGGRAIHTAVWTGSRMLVWGGSNSDTGSPLSDGGAYDPSTDTWTPISTAGAPAARFRHTAVWTGSRMIVFGGQGASAVNSGGAYDPGANTWSPTDTSGAPAARAMHTAVWTGSRMIVFGGRGAADLNTGGVYDPGGNTWTPTATNGAPSARFLHTAVWTGSRMVIFGGAVGTTRLNTGGVYQPPLQVSSLAITDAAVSEPSPGPTTVLLTVSLAPASTQNVTVDFATADGSATTPGDYLTATGTLSFAPGETAKTISVTVNGDAVAESTETFVVNLTNATNAAITDAQGVVTIRQPLRFYTVEPCRVFDTRDPNGPLGGPVLSAGQQRAFTVTGGPCAIPASAKSVSINLTVVSPGAAGFVTVFPGDGTLPSTSSINFSAGQVRANNGVFPLAGDGSGRVNVVNGSTGNTHVILDVNGYFE